MSPKLIYIVFKMSNFVLPSISIKSLLHLQNKTIACHKTKTLHNLYYIYKTSQLHVTKLKLKGGCIYRRHIFL